MLEEIRCNKFIEKAIVFHSGLNVVIGDDLASNSIGKSSLLMIIDFAFGGSDYIKKNHDAIEQLGPHEFNFKFNFNDEKMYFTRNTKNYSDVTICDEYFKHKEEIKLEDYTKLLQKKYQCEIPDLTFRLIVGRYFRIYGKENLNEHKPIQYFEKESTKLSIQALIKLFNKYNTLKTYEEQITAFDEEKTLLASAAKKDLIPNVNEAAFSRNLKTIEELSRQLEAVKEDIINVSNDIEALVSEEVLLLKKDRSALAVRKNVLNARLSRIKTNLDSRNINLNLELQQFTLYFPDFNIEQAQKVDKFHTNLTKILKGELRSAEKDLREQISELDFQISGIDAEILAQLNIKNAPKFAIEKVIELASQIEQLTDENGYFTKYENLKNKLKNAKEDLSSRKETVLNDICNQINTRMYELNKQIYADTRRSPTLSINGDRYTFSTYGDTGTGTAFANLITFDLTLLELTCLPAIAHDLPLLKNIENPALEKIISLYAASQKQIFIAIDKIHSYAETTSKIIEAQGVIKLSKDRTLFIKNWKNTAQ